MQGTRTDVTNEAGEYRFPAVPPGTYKLVYELGGFGTVNREGVSVGLGFTATVNIELGGRQPPGDRHGQRRIAGGRHLHHHHRLELRGAAARRPAQCPRLLGRARRVAGDRRHPHRRRRQRRRHPDRLRRLRHQGRPAPPDGRGHRQHRGHQRCRLLLRLRRHRRGGGHHQGPHRRDAVAGRVVELRRPSRAATPSTARSTPTTRTRACRTRTSTTASRSCAPAAAAAT